jgi:hypothetical protein
MYASSTDNNIMFQGGIIEDLAIAKPVSTTKGASKWHEKFKASRA